ncbi:MAG TPA: hypothetical protein VM845_14975 [Burkholderiaceae bacterium]|nr:hypothetical protein [Burkholderiaceae bacterium]
MNRSTSQLQQALMNLVQNAYDAAAGPGREQPQLWIEVRIEGASLIVALRERARDSGAGPGAHLRPLLHHHRSTRARVRTVD